MDDAPVVRLLEGLGDLPGDLQGLVDGHAAPLQPLGEVLARDELEDQERLAVGLLEAVDGRDLRMVEGGEELRLAPEASQPLGVLPDLGGQDLDRHLAAQLRVGGPVHLAHTPGAQWGEDSIRTEGLARSQGQENSFRREGRAGFYNPRVRLAGPLLYSAAIPRSREP